MGRRSNGPGIVDRRIISVMGRRIVICGFKPHRVAGTFGLEGRGVVGVFSKVAFSLRRVALVTKKEANYC